MNTEDKCIGVKVSNKACIGCKRHQKDILVTMLLEPEKVENKIDFHDYFLTTEQAEDLITQLNKQLEFNSNDLV